MLLDKRGEGGQWMTDLTQKELLYLKDAIEAENLMVEKFGVCAENATDPDVKRLCKDIQSTHRTHKQTLTQFVTGGGGRMH